MPLVSQTPVGNGNICLKISLYGKYYSPPPPANNCLIFVQKHCEYGDRRNRVQHYISDVTCGFPDIPCIPIVSYVVDYIEKSMILAQMVHYIIEFVIE